MGLMRRAGIVFSATWMTLKRQAAGAIALQHGGPLRLAWIDQRYTGAGRLALSSLPGFPMFRRSLAADLETLRLQRVDHILCLLEDHEFSTWGVPELMDSYANGGFIVQRRPIRDQSVCTLDAMRETVAWLSDKLAGGETVMVHCVGGLGRSGMVAACYLIAASLVAEEAIAEVRHTRSPYAIETAEQEAFVHLFANETMG